MADHKTIKYKSYIKNILNTFSLLLVITISTFIFSKGVKADNFYSSGGNITFCNLAMTTSISYRELPINSRGNKFTFDITKVSGANGNYPPTHRFAPDLGTLAFPKPERYRGISDNIKVPPNTVVDLGYYTHNYSGHSVNITNAWAFVSKPNPSEGDWTRLGSAGDFGTLNWNLDGKIQSRSGKLINIGPQGNRINDPSGNFSNQVGKAVHSFKTIQPIIIQYRNVTPELANDNSLRIRYDLSLKNQSVYNLSNILMENPLPNGETFSKTENFGPGESKLITYYAEMGNKYNQSILIEAVTVTDPNEHVEVNAGPEDMVVIARRNDSGAPANWTATQPDFHLPLSITLLPYKIYSDEDTLKLPSELIVNKKVSDTDEIDVKSNTANPGEILKYKVSLKNIGARSFDTILVDNYDESKIKIIDNGGAQDNGDELKWNLGTLENGDVREFTIVGKINDIFPQGTYQAPNIIIGKNRDNPEVTDSTQTTIITKADLIVKKLITDNDETLVKENTVQGDTENAGREIIYTIEVSNIGNAAADNVTIEDDYDQENISILDIGSGIATDGIIRWNIGSILPGEIKYVTVKALVDKNIKDLTLINNIARVKSTQTGDTSDTAITKVVAPNIIIEKTVSDPDEFNVKSNKSLQNEELIYKITVKNTGNGILNSAKVIDDYDQNNVSITDTNNGTDNGETITWNISNLLPGESITFEIKSRIKQLYTQKDYEFLNKVKVETNYGSVEDTTKTTVNIPVITLIKGADKLEYQSFEEAVYSIEVANTGTAQAIGVIKDTLPDGLIFKSSNWDKDRTRLNGKDLEFDVTLEPKQKTKIFITVTFENSLKDLTILNNTAIYKYKEPYVNYPEVKSTVDVLVRRPNINLGKTADNSDKQLKVGDKIKYTIFYENKGSGIVKDFLIIDAIPQNTVYVENSAKPSENHIVGEGATGVRQIEWKLGDLAPGSKGEVSFDVILKDVDSNQSIKNTAFAKSTNYSEIPSNEVIIKTYKPEILGVQDLKVEKDEIKTNSNPTKFLSNTGEGITLKTFIISLLLIASGTLGFISRKF